MITVNELIASLPGDIVMKPETPCEIRKKYQWIRETLNRYANKCADSMVCFNRFNKFGNQYIADFSVKDLSLPEKNEYNWHLQNTSQWLFAGCLLVENGVVSIHT